MMPRLQAQELLDAATASALGGGAMKKGDARRISGRLERQAHGPVRAARVDPGTAQGRAVLGAMGIAVQEARGDG